MPAKAQMVMKCYDCGGLTDDWVMETRQVSGGDGIVYEGDFQPRPVHTNRRECIAVRVARRVEEQRARDPFYDVPAC